MSVMVRRAFLTSLLAAPLLALVSRDRARYEAQVRVLTHAWNAHVKGRGGPTFRGYGEFSIASM